MKLGNLVTAAALVCSTGAANATVLTEFCFKTIPVANREARHPTYQVLYDTETKIFIVNTYERLVPYRVKAVLPEGKALRVGGMTKAGTSFTMTFPNPTYRGPDAIGASMVSSNAQGEIVSDDCQEEVE